MYWKTINMGLPTKLGQFGVDRYVLLSTGRLHGQHTSGGVDGLMAFPPFGPITCNLLSVEIKLESLGIIFVRRGPGFFFIGRMSTEQIMNFILKRETFIVGLLWSELVDITLCKKSIKGISLETSQVDKAGYG